MGGDDLDLSGRLDRIADRLATISEKVTALGCEIDSLRRDVHQCMKVWTIVAMLLGALIVAVALKT